MSSRTGLGPMEVGVLDALAAVGAVPGRPYVRTMKALTILEDQTGIPPRAGYQVVCDLSRPWAVHLQLIDFHGNVGSLDFGPADAQYTECRLSPLGAAALAAERGAGDALPIGLVNGTTYVGGRRPPFDPRRLTAALRFAAQGADDVAIVGALGLPSFPAGCDVVGDVAGLLAGDDVTLTLRAVIIAADPERVVITHLPPDIGAAHAWSIISGSIEHDERFRSIRDIRDESDFGPSRLVLDLYPGADVSSLGAALLERWPLTTTVDLGLGAPAVEILRTWLRLHSTVHLDDRLALIETGATWRGEQPGARGYRPIAE